MKEWSLTQILENDELVMEEILAIPNILTKIKLNMKIFVKHCIRH